MATATSQPTPASPSAPAPPVAAPPPASVASQPPPAAHAPGAQAPASGLSRLARGTAWFAVVVGSIVAVHFGIHWWSYRFSHSITEDAFVEAHIVNVAPEMVSGRVVRFLVEENDQVEQDQVLAEVEPVHYRDQVEQARGKLDLAEAELKRQEAGLEKLKKEVPLQIDVARQTLTVAQTDAERAKYALTLTTDEVNKTIDEAKAAVEVAEANLTLAKLEYDRFTQLASQNATPKRRADEVTRGHDAAKAELRLTEAKLAKGEAARTRIDVSRRDLEVAQAMVTKAEKALDLAETGYDQIREVELMVAAKKEIVNDAQIALASAEHVLEFTQVRAPFPGIVVKRYRSLGDYISAGTPILSMYNPELLYVTANLEETRLQGLAPGNLVELRLDAFEKPFRGRVVWINKSTGAQFALLPRNVVSGEFTKVVQRVPVRIWIENDDRRPLLRAGLSAHVVIAHGDGDPAWAEGAAKEMAQVEMRYNLKN